MKENILQLIKCGLAILLLSCLSQNTLAQSFTPLANIPGTGQDFDGGMAFELNGNIYAGAGFYSKTLYMYDISSDTWTTKNELPGSVYSRSSALTFTINGKAYMLNGDDINPTTFTYTKLLDFYEYDESSDSWTALPAPPFTYRRNAGIFVINNKVYIVGGYDDTNTNTKTTWEFDGIDWVQKVDFPTPNIAQPSTFVLEDKAYVACGLTKVTTTTQTNLLFEYDPAADSWSSKAGFPGEIRAGAMGFSAGGIGFCGLGSYVNSSFQFVYHNDFYSYDPVSDAWALVNAAFPGPSRQAAMAVSHDNKAYIGAGWSFMNSVNAYFRDWFEFENGSLDVVNDIKTTDKTVYPNPASDKLYLFDESTWDVKDKQVQIVDISGRTILESNLDNDNSIDISVLKSGIYFIHHLADSKIVRFIKR